MRYYKVEIGGSYPATFTNQVNGKFDPGALNVEMDIPVTTFAQPAGQAFVRLWGVSLQQISQAADFNNAPIKVYGGMQQGLPLANPQQAGLLASGTIIQAFGNWIGVNQTLDLVIIPDGGAAAGGNTKPNISWNWPAGTDFGAAIKTTLLTAYPGYTVNPNIHQSISLGEQDNAGFTTLEDFSSHIQQLSKGAVNNDTYDGVQIFLNQTTFNVFDAASASNPKMIQYQDLIGQPTWIEFNTIQFNAVMRADVSIGDFIKFPNTPLVTNVVNNQSQYRTKGAFNGIFQISYARHVGNLRVADAYSWISTFNCYPAVQ